MKPQSLRDGTGRCLLVFLGFTLNIHVLQYVANVLRQFCRPVLERDIEERQKEERLILYRLVEQKDQTEYFQTRTVNREHKG